MKIQEYRMLLKKMSAERKAKKRNKYGNVKTDGCAYGYSHTSKLEAAVCQMNYLQEKAGDIEHVSHECLIALTDSKIGYRADFQLRDLRTGQIFYREAKGAETDTWKLKKRLYKNYGPGKLEIWGGYHTRPVLQETIIPRVSAVIEPTLDPKQSTIFDYIGKVKT